jgi:hypothetical protein
MGKSLKDVAMVEQPDLSRLSSVETPEADELLCFQQVVFCIVSVPGKNGDLHHGEESHEYGLVLGCLGDVVCGLEH